MMFSRDTTGVINGIEKKNSLKGVGHPEYCLGGIIEVLGEKLTKESLNIALSLETYVKTVIPNLMKIIKKENLRLIRTPMSSVEHPEVDKTDIIKDRDKISIYIDQLLVVLIG